MKFGFDIHGVIDTCPKLFSTLTRLFVANGHEVHIITGPELTHELYDKLYFEYGIAWTHFFSIVEYHKKIGTAINYDDTGSAHLDPYEWDKTKGWYCKTNEINLHFDDSDSYSYFFKTPYARFLSRDTMRVNKLEV
jgi:hypothetical protein